MAQQHLLKNNINKQSIAYLARMLDKAIPGLARAAFEKQANTGLSQLELKQRVYHLIEVLHDHLPANFPRAARLLVKVKQYWQKDKDNPQPYEFTAWALIDYIGVYGRDYPQQSLQTLAQLTSLFSAEFAIRPFIEADLPFCMDYLERWCEHKDQQVRRLASEGMRPRLPWGQRIPRLLEDPAPIIVLLEKLKNDPSDYVRRSVANNLNDIAKDHPDLVVKICKRWQKDRNPATDWIIKHGCRGLIKAGHGGAMALFGYKQNPNISIKNLKLNRKNYKVGDTLEFCFQLQSREAQKTKLVVDYAVHFKKNNDRHNAKVFKLKAFDMAAQQTVELQKKHSLKAITTRKYYAGEQQLEILVNGAALAKISFNLQTR